MNLNIFFADTGGCNQEADISKSSSLMRVREELANILSLKNAQKHGGYTPDLKSGYIEIVCDLEEFYFGG